MDLQKQKLTTNLLKFVVVVRELVMKMLLKLMLCCVLVSPIVVAEDIVDDPVTVDEEVVIHEDGENLEVPFEEVEEEPLEKKLIIPNIVYVKCTLDLNQWGHSSNCDCGKSSTYDQKLGKCLPKKLADRPKPRALRCDKDLNQWGHSGSCECASEKFDYDERVGKCVLARPRVGDHPSIEDETLNDSPPMEHCAGGSFSADFKHLTCPDGRVYKEQTNTLGEIGRDIHGAREHDLRDEVVDEDTEFPAVITER